MPVLAPAYTQCAYRLAENLQPPSEPDRLAHAEPGSAAREELLLAKLGPRGWGRLHHFRRFYSPGWGEGRGRSLSPRATEAFFSFLAAARFPEGVQPSLFLTDEGGLELAWEENGEAVQVAFQPGRLELYRKGDGTDRELPLQRWDEAAQHLCP